MKILHLTIKKKFFDMIASGEKKEEYREIKDYWIRRLQAEMIHESDWDVDTSLKTKHFDIIEFKNGYGKNAPAMFVEFKGVEIGEAKPKWNDNWKGDVFKIKRGKIL